jgi:hypothetical protein
MYGAYDILDTLPANVAAHVKPRKSGPTSMSAA